jgi:hypothetical protein
LLYTSFRDSLARKSWWGGYVAALLGRLAKAGILAAALLVLAVEGVLLIRYYDGPEAASSTAGANSPAAFGPTFVHRATDANSRGDFTYLDHSSINGDPDAVVLAEPSPGQGGHGGAPYGHNIGVWYEPTKKKWVVFNQDLAPVPTGSAFAVVVPPTDRGFVHRAAQENTVGRATYIDNPLLNGEPDAGVSVIHYWNPGGGVGVYPNDHPVGALYDEDVEKWFVYNEDAARMPEGAAFNVAVSGTEPAR